MVFFLITANLIICSHQFCRLEKYYYHNFLNFFSLSKLFTFFFFFFESYNSVISSLLSSLHLLPKSLTLITSIKQSFYLFSSFFVDFFSPIFYYLF